VLSGNATATFTTTGVTGFSGARLTNCAKLNSEDATTSITLPKTNTTYTFTCSAGVEKSSCDSVTLVAPPPNEITYCTYTKGGWASPPNGNNPGALLDSSYLTTYPNGVAIGSFPTDFYSFWEGNSEVSVTAFPVF
jgi:hypothetical protein